MTALRLWLARLVGLDAPAIASGSLLGEARMADPERRAVVREIRSLVDWPDVMLRDGRMVAMAPWDIALLEVPLEDLTATVRDLRRLAACVFETLAREGRRDLLRAHFEQTLDAIEQRMGVASVVDGAFDERAAGDPEREADAACGAGAGKADHRKGEGEVFRRPGGDGLARREPASALHDPDPLTRVALRAAIDALLDAHLRGFGPEPRP